MPALISKNKNVRLRWWAWLATFSQPRFGSGDNATRVINEASLELVSSQQLCDYLELALADVEYAKLQFQADGTYVPPPSGQKTPLQAAMAESSWAERLYFGPIMPFVSGNAYWHVEPHWENVSSPTGSSTLSTLLNQTTIDQSKIAAAVELHHRRTGKYPASLDEIGIPLPHNPATGTAYEF